MQLKQARTIAEKYLELLSPHCIRIEIAGSIRRGRQEPGDIELVCIPKAVTIEDGMFDKKEIRDPGFVDLVNSFGRVKGTGEGKYTQIILAEGLPYPETIKLDLFMTTPEQWGVIFMIRTGSSFFSKRMVTDIKPKGFYVEEGWLWCADYGEGKMRIPCYEEEDFFTKTGMEYLQPEMRVF